MKRRLQVYLRGNRLPENVVGRTGGVGQAQNSGSGGERPIGNHQRRVEYERRGGHPLPVHHRSIHLGLKV